MRGTWEVSNSVGARRREISGVGLALEVGSEQRRRERVLEVKGVLAFGCGVGLSSNRCGTHCFHR